MNNVVLIGNLGKDPELTTTPSGKSVCKFSLAVQNQTKGDDGRYGVDFFNIMVWNAPGENCAKFLTKGKKAAVKGRLTTRSWEQDGVKRYATDIVAEQVEFLSPRGDNTQGEPNDGLPGDMTPLADDSDLPF